MIFGLETTNLTRDFRGFRAVDRVNLRVVEGTVHALVGPNGAGKTTLFNMLTGILPASSGSIVLFGREITKLRPDQIARRGVARSFQITSLFDQMTAYDNVQLALLAATSLGYCFWLPAGRLSRFSDSARLLLEQVGLQAVAQRKVGTLPYGQKRALEVAL